MFSLGWVELNDRHFIEEVTIVCGIFRGFSVLDGVFPVSGLFLFFTSTSAYAAFFCNLLKQIKLYVCMYVRLDVVLFQEIFVHFCTALRILLRSCLTGLVYRNTIGN